MGRSWPRWASTVIRSPGRPAQAPMVGSSAESFGGLEVDDELELRGLLDGKIGWLSTLEDLVNEATGGPQRSAKSGPYDIINDPSSTMLRPYVMVANRLHRANAAT